MLPSANGKKEAKRMADEWLATLNAEADKMPNASKAKTLDETFREYLKFQLDTGAIEKSTYSNSIHSYNKYIQPYGDANADALVIASAKLSDKFKDSLELEQLIEEAKAETDNDEE